MPVTIFKYNPL